MFFIGDWLRISSFKLDFEEPYGEMFATVVNITFVLIFILFYTHKVLGRTLKDFMICKPLPKLKWCFVSIVIPVLICLFYIYGMDGVFQENVLSTEDMTYVISFTIFRTGICAGIVEEVVFRGMLMNYLDIYFQRKWAIIISALLFAAIHITYIEFSIDMILILVSTTLAGIAFSFVAYETGSVWSGVALHAMYNIITSGQFLEIATEHYFPTIWTYTLDTRNPLFTGGNYGITAGLPTIIGFVIIILLADKDKESLLPEDDRRKGRIPNHRKQCTVNFMHIIKSICLVITAMIIVAWSICFYRDRITCNVNSEISSQTIERALTENEKEIIVQSPRYQSVLSKKNNYPVRMIEDLERNPEMLDFVEQYKSTDSLDKIILTSEETKEKSPLFIQWDKRWGYIPYGNSIIGLSGCGPTCLSMVIYSLTENPDATPDAIAAYSMKNGYYVEGVGTSWALMTDIADNYGIRVNVADILSEKEMKSCISSGSLIICSMGPGDFTAQGHFIVIRGYDKKGFIVNDPFSYTNSSKVWSYDKLAPQICKMWVYTLK